MHLQVLYFCMVIADVTAEGVIDSSHCPINLRQILFYPVQCSGCFPESQKTANDLFDHMITLHSSHCEAFRAIQLGTLLECPGCEATRRLGWPLRSSRICSNRWSCSERTACRPAAPGSSQTGASEPGWSWTPPRDPVAKKTWSQIKQVEGEV